MWKSGSTLERQPDRRSARGESSLVKKEPLRTDGGAPGDGAETERDVYSEDLSVREALRCKRRTIWSKVGRAWDANYMTFCSGTSTITHERAWSKVFQLLRIWRFGDTGFHSQGECSIVATVTSGF